MKDRDVTHRQIWYHPAQFKKEGIASILSVPITVHDNVIGALRVYTSQAWEFTLEDVNFVHAVAQIAGMAIDLCRLTKCVVRHTGGVHCSSDNTKTTKSISASNQRLRFLNEGEIDRLLCACSEYLRRIVRCAILTGMRRGEILSLKWEQIRNGFIYLDKKFNPIKTREARQIPVSDDLDELFKEIRIWHRSAKEKGSTS